MLANHNVHNNSDAMNLFIFSYSFVYPGRSIRLSDSMLDYIGIRRSDIIPIGFRVTELHWNPSEADPIGLSVGSDSQIRCVKKGVF